MVLTMSLVALIVFIITNLIPGSPASVILGKDATSEDVAELNHELGLDRPVPIRLVAWIGDVLQGDLGRSLYTNKSVSKVLLTRLEPTAILALTGVAIAVFVGLPLGIIAAIFHRKWIDITAVSMAVGGVSIPFFWLGLNMILLFSLYLKWLPAAGYTSILVNPWESLSCILLPSAAIGLHHAGSIARMSRTNLLEVLRADYVQTARSKGLTEWTVIMVHAFRNALVPTISVIGVVTALIIGGSPVIETVFAIPGIGRLTIESVLRRDFPMIQGCILIIAASVALVNLLVDIIYAWLDPRISYS